MFVFHCFSFWRLDDTMVFVTFYIDSAERTCRTQVFASTATDTAFRIDDRDHYGLVLFAVFTTSSMAVTAVERNHLYSSDRTMSSTIPAIYSIGKRMQFFFTHTAWPICMLDFSATVMGRMAPVGHTSEHLVHSGRQYPRSYDISGCMKVIRLPDGRKT